MWAIWSMLPFLFCLSSANAQVPSPVYQTQVYGRGNADSQPGAGDAFLGKSAMAVDAAGNIYVAGTTFNGLNKDFLTVKYSPAGAILWRAISNGVTNENDLAYAVAVDNLGGVFVTGNTQSNGQTDFMTVKYSSNSGAELWRAILDGGVNGDDSASAIAVDVGGNAFVTGPALTPSGSIDYVTVKYSPTGAELWRMTMQGTANDIDKPVAICLDSGGNPTVTGWGTTSPGTNYDYITVKYTDNNNLPFIQWQQRLNGPANSFDVSYAMACDLAGNVYVTGNSLNGTNGFDYLTVKYSAMTGMQQWTKTLNGTNNASDTAVAIAVDGLGNVLVTGKSQNGGVGPAETIHLTVKYDSAGTEQWRAPLDGSGTGSEPFTALAADADGNVYATGFADNNGNNELVVVKYAPAGGVAWQKFISGSANGAGLMTIKLDGSNVIVAGYRSNGIDNDFLVVKFDASGNELWRKDEGENTQLAATFASGQSGKNALAIDSAGNVYITGQSGIAGLSDFITAKIDPSGTTQWRTPLNGPTSGVDRAYALAIDGGNTYVTGESFSGGTSDFMTAKYGATGLELWRTQPGHGPGVSNSAKAMTVVAGGDVVVTGTTTLGNDFLTIKYRGSDGVALWPLTTANSGSTNVDTPVGIAADTAGNTIVLGKTNDGTLDGYMTIKYSPTGQELWRKTLAGSASVAMQPFALVLDLTTGDVVVAGDALVKYAAANGALIWQAADAFRAYAVAFAPDGSVVAAGAGGLIAKYDASNGGQQWRRAINGMPDGNDVVYAVTVDGDGAIYATTRNLADSNANYVTIKLSANGAERWRVTTGTGGGGGIASPALMLDANRNVIVAGNAVSPGQPTAIVVAKFSQAPSPPINVAAVAGSTLAYVTFAPPAILDAPITNYTVTCGLFSVSGVASPIIVTGLTDETPYICRVTATNVYGTSSPSGPVNVTPSAMAPLALFSVQSRLTHGIVGAFALAIDTAYAITGPISVEPRAFNSSHRVVFNFNSAIATPGTATVTNAAMVDLGAALTSKVGNSVEVALPSISDATRVKISLTGVNGNAGAFTASIGFLYGDVSRSRAINAADIAAIKARSGQPVSVGDNYRFDINLNGAINAIDVSAVKARSGFKLP